MKKYTKPLSPHLQVYKPQITSILSITHRITGIILFFSSFFLALWLFSMAYNENIKNLVNTFFSLFFGKTILFFISFSFFYHLLNGIRHLFWDIGYGYKLSNVYITGLLVIVLTLIINIYIWFFL